MARRGRIDQIYDLAAIEAQNQKVMGLVSDFIKVISDIKPITLKLEGAEKTKDIIDGIKEVNNSMNKTVETSTKVVNAMGQLQDSVKKSAISFDDQKKILEQYTGSLSQNTRVYTEYKVQLDSLKKAQRDLDIMYKDGTISLGEYKNESSKLTAAQNEIKVNAAELMQTIKAQTKEQAAAATSYDELNHRLGQSRDLFRQLTEAERESEFGQQLLGSIQEMDAKLKSIDASMGNFQRSVGNYGGRFSGAFDVLEARLKEVGGMLEKLEMDQNANGDAVAELRREYELLENIVEGQVKGFVNLQQEIKSNTTALQQMAAAGLDATDTYKQLFNETVQLKDNFNDLKEELKFTSDNVSGLDKAVNNLNQLAAAYQVVEGAAALMGTENEDLQKTMVRLMAVQSIVNGLFQLNEEIKRKGSIVNTLYTAGLRLKTFVLTGSTKAVAANTAAMAANTTATTATTTATRVATGAMIGLRAAMIATGIGALLILLPMVASGMGLFSSKTDDAADSQKRLADEIERTKGILADLNSQFDEYLSGIERQTKAAVLAAKERGASEAEISRIEQSGLMRRRQEMLDKKALLDAQYANDRNSVEELRAINAERTKVEGQIADVTLEIRQKSYDRIKSLSEKQKDLYAREIKAQFELMKYLKQQHIEALKTGAGDETLNVTVRTKFATEQLEKEEELIRAIRDFELKEANKTASERKLIEEKANKDIITARTQYIADLAKIRVQNRDRDTADIVRDGDLINAAIDQQNEYRLSQFQKILDEEVSKTERGANLKLIALNKEYSNGTISKTKYEDEKLKIENKALARSLVSQIDYYKKLVYFYSADEEQKQAALNRIAELERELTGITASEADNRIAKSKEVGDALKQLASELTGLAFDLFSAPIERELNSIQKVIDAIEIKKQKELEAVDQAILNEQEKAAAIALIEARANAERETQERKQRQLNIQKSRWERAQSIAEVVQNTGIAVTGYLAQQNYVMAILSGIIGAAQITRIVATPLPRYKDGIYEDGETHPGGLAVVGDGGKPEYIQTPTGDVYRTPSVDTVVDLPKGSQVFPDLMTFAKAMVGGELQRSLSIDGLKQPNDLYAVQKMTGSIDRMRKDVVGAIKNIPQTNVLSENQIKVWVHSGYSSYEKFGK